MSNDNKIVPLFPASVPDTDFEAWLQARIRDLFHVDLLEEPWRRHNDGICKPGDCPYDHKKGARE